MKLGCIGKDIDGVELTTLSLLGDDGVVTFTSRLLPTVFKRVLCKHVIGTVKSDSAAWKNLRRLPSFLCLPSLCKDREMLNTKYPHPHRALSSAYFSCLLAHVCFLVLDKTTQHGSTCFNSAKELSNFVLI
jgi:hypothetical protein